jgi:hypothetical protein
MHADERKISLTPGIFTYGRQRIQHQETARGGMIVIEVKLKRVRH